MRKYKELVGIFLIMLMLLPPVMHSTAMPTHDDSNLWIEKFHPSLLAKVLSGQIKDNDVVTVVFRLQPLPPYTSTMVRGHHDQAVNALKSWASLTQGPFITEVYKKGGKVLNTFWIDNIVIVQAKLSTIKQLSNNPMVVKVFENFKVKAIEPVSRNRVEPKSSIESWGIFKINATDAWDLGYTGEGVRIAILDTGVDITHPALDGKMLTLDPDSPYYPGGWIEFDEYGNPVLSQPHDTDGHGTHTSGTALGGDTNDILIGVAPGATLMHALILPGGSGSFAQVLAGIQWAVDPFYIDPDSGEPIPSEMPANVISMSLGASGYYENDLLPGIEAALMANIVVVAAIGNDGQGTSSNPGNIWGVFGVGATDEDDTIAYFSSGEIVNWPDPPEEWPFYNTYPDSYIKPDFSAPGVDITSSVPGGDYQAWSGTSMATPHVAGTVALILQASGWYLDPVPDIPEKVYEILSNTSIDLGEPGQDTEYGYGRIDAYKAVLLAQEYGKKTGVEGQVLDSIDNNPVPWTTITVLETDRTYHVLADGSFKIPLDPGIYNLTFSAWGYQNKTIQVTVEANNGTLIGFVYDYLSGNPISGAQINIVEANLTTYTNETGYFVISLPPGTYTLEVYASGYNPYNTTVQVEENQTVLVPIPLTPSGYGAIEGYVFDNETGDPLANATIVVDNGPLMAVTNDSGYFKIDNVPVGAHVVSAYMAGYSAQSKNITVLLNETTYVEFYLEPVSGSVIVLGNVVYKTEPHLADILSSLGYNVTEYVDVSDLINDWVNFEINPLVIVIDHFKQDPDDMPSLEEVLALMYLADETNTPLIFLGAAYSSYNAIYVLIHYSSDILEEGYPAPVEREEHYPGPEYVKVVMLNETHPIFDNVIPDDDSWFYLADLDNSYYADYMVMYWDNSSQVTILANISDDDNSLNASVIAEWTTSTGVKWLYMSSFGESYWMQYIEPGADGVYSNNTMLVLENAVKYCIESKMSASPSGNNVADIMKVKRMIPDSTPISNAYTNITVYLEREPYGYIQGKVVGSDGAILSGAKISVENTPIVHYTEENGSFKFWLPAGSYKLIVSAPGYKEEEINVTINVNDTTDLGIITLHYIPRIAILYDYQGELRNLIMSNLSWYAEDFNNPSAFAGALESGFFNAGIWAGYYYAPFPSYDEFMEVWNVIETTGISVIFLDQWSNDLYPDLFGYGINAMHTHLGDPSIRITDDTYGGIYIKILENSPLFEGYSVGETIQVFYENPGWYGTDYAAFSGFSGTTLASLILEDGTSPGDAIGYKVLDNGAKIILLAGWAPEEYQDIGLWTTDGVKIFLNAVKWAAQKPFTVTPPEVEAHVGDSITYDLSDLPSDYVVNVYLDGVYKGSIATSADGRAEYSLTVPLIPGGSHIVSFIGDDELYRADSVLIVLPKVEVNVSYVSSPGMVSMNITGLHAYQEAMIYMESNYLGTITADRYGHAEALVNIPVISGGTHLLRVLDTTGSEIASWGISVDSLLEDIYSSTTTIMMNTETLLSILSSMNASITAVINDNMGNLYALINTSNGQILAELTDINKLVEIKASKLQDVINQTQGSIEAVINDNMGNLYALINTSNGQILLKIDKNYQSLSDQISSSEQNIINEINQLKGLFEQNTTQLSQQISEAKSTASTGQKLGGAALVFSLAGILMVIRTIKP